MSCCWRRQYNSVTWWPVTCGVEHYLSRIWIAHSCDWRKSTVVWIVTPCSSERIGRSGGTYCLHLRDGIVGQAKKQLEQATSWNVGLSPNYTALQSIRLQCYILESWTSVWRLIFGKYATLIRIVLIESRNMETFFFHDDFETRLARTTTYLQGFLMYLTMI
jgi:hypothetical protein